MNKLKRIGIAGVLSLALSLSIAGTGQAALTLGATSTASDGALTLTGATASTWSTTTGDLTLQATAASVNVNANEAAADQIKLSAAGTIAGNAINLNTTNGGIILTAANATNGDITITSADDTTVNPTGILTLTSGEAATWSTTTGDLTLQATAASVNVNANEAAADQIKLSAAGTVAGNAINAVTTDGGIVLTAGGASNGDITLTVGDDFTLNGVGGSVYSIGAATTSGTITIGGTSQTGATTIYGGSTTNAVVVNANVGAVATEAHGLDVVSVGELSSGDNLVGVNSVLTPTGTAGTWASAVYGKVVQGATKRVNGYISGGEFEVADTNAAPSEVHTLVLDGNSTAFDANSSYIWGQTFGGADMPNLLKLTGLASGTGNMWYGPTLRMKIGDSTVASRYLIMSETENKLDLGDGSGGIDIGTATTGINFTGTNSSAITLSSMTPGAAAGPLILAGTSGSPITTATADTKFVQMYTKSTATGAGSDTRGIYDRLYLAGATTGGGEALRAYTTIDDAVVGTAHGTHSSLDFDSTANSARLTGLGVAGRNTLHIPSDAAWTSGTLAAVQAEIYSDGANSDSDGLTELSFVRVVNDGNATGKGNVDDDAALFSLSGFEDNNGNMVDTGIANGTAVQLRIKINGVPYYLNAYPTAN